jgi:hypothetical protein
VIWDSTPFYIRQAENQSVARINLNGHYPGNCVLVLIGVTFKGEIVFGSDLVRSTSYDANTYLDTMYLHPQHPYERNVGDGHFSTCPNFDTPPKKPQNGHLSQLELFYCQIIQLVRSRVEHVNEVIKHRHTMFKQDYAGTAEHLQVFVRITLHASALMIRNQRDNGNFKYDGYGWWPHSP